MEKPVKLFPKKYLNRKSKFKNPTAVHYVQGSFLFCRAKYFNNVQTYEVGNCSPNQGIYMYNFSLFPDKHQPSGTCNFSKLDTASLNFEFEEDIW